MVAIENEGLLAEVDLNQPTKYDALALIIQLDPF